MLLNEMEVLDLKVELVLMGVLMSELEQVLEMIRGLEKVILKNKIILIIDSQDGKSHKLKKKL
jgi:hypothetical protein